jgi:L-Ala-D/L-Glu epimerase
MKLTLQRRKLHLRHPFLIARKMDDRSTDKNVLLVRLEHEGKVGWGEAAPISYYHQSLDSAEEALTEMGKMLGNDPFALDAVFDPIWEKFADQSAAICALDGAFYDLMGKILDVPVWKMLGLDRRRVPLTSFTIGIDTPEIVARKVDEAAEYPVLKIKVGTDQDEAMLNIIREKAPDKSLYVDANCGWTSANVLERCKFVSRYKLDLIEQPMPPGMHDGLAEVRAAVSPPIMADESCVSVDDVLKCVPHFDGVNIKLSKCGGIRRALKMIHTARSAGIKVMLGCMVETSVGISSAVTLSPLVDFIDLDGHLLLADDPFEGIGGAKGVLTLNDRPGLGVVERK